MEKKFLDIPLSFRISHELNLALRQKAQMEDLPVGELIRKILHNSLKPKHINA